MHGLKTKIYTLVILSKVVLIITKAFFEMTYKYIQETGIAITSFFFFQHWNLNSGPQIC
jgi:hypothetical protein